MALILEIGKAFADSIFGQGRYPETLDGYFATSFLVHPTLDELSLLAGITTVDDHFGFRDKLFDGIKLFEDSFVITYLDTKTCWHHRQGGHIPPFPLFIVFMWIK